jgi:hypothetical protein
MCWQTCALEFCWAQAHLVSSAYDRQIACCMLHTQFCHFYVSALMVDCKLRRGG